MAKKKLKYSINRTLLTEFLPYETPFHFSNQFFYEFVNKNNIFLKYDGDKTFITTDNSSIPKEIFELLFNHKFDSDHSNQNICKAFKFKITHPKNIFRELAIIHPRSQLFAVFFYNKYKEVILYNTKKASFSLRYPSRIAQYAYYKDKRFYNSLIQDKSIIEIDNHQYEHAKSFFSYKKYSNISMLYDSDEFHENEKNIIY